MYLCTPRSVNSLNHALSEITFASPAICEYPLHKALLLLSSVKVKGNGESSMTVRVLF